MGYGHLPKCGAKAKSNNRSPCRQVALANGRCYYHGGAMTIKHGRYTKQAVAARKETRKRIKEHRESLKALEEICNV